MADMSWDEAFAPPSTPATVNGLPMAQTDPGGAQAQPAPAKPAAAPQPMSWDDVFGKQPSQEVSWNEVFGQPEPQSRLGAIARAGEQGAVSATGQMVEGAGQQAQQAGRRDIGTALGVMDRIDAGQKVPDDQDVLGYQYMSPDQRAQARKGMQADAAVANQNKPTALTQAGRSMQAYADKRLAVDPAQEGIATGVARTLGGLGPIVAGAGAASLVGGPEAGLGLVAGMMNAQSYASTYNDAIKKGATADQADDAAKIAGATQAALGSVPVSHVVSMVPAPLRDGFLKTVANLTKNGVEFAGVNALLKFGDNYTAQQTYDPKRKLGEGVFDNIPENVLAGMVVPGATLAAHGVARGVGAVADRLNRNANPASPTPDQPTPPGPSPNPTPAPGPSPAPTAPAPAPTPPAPAPAGPRPTPQTPEAMAEQELLDIAAGKPVSPTAPAPGPTAPPAGPTAAPPASPPMVAPHPAPDGSGALTNLSDADYEKLQAQVQQSAPPAADAKVHTPGPTENRPGQTTPASGQTETPAGPTTVEPPRDVQAQLAALADPGNPKDAVWLAKGTPVPADLPPGAVRVKRQEGTLITTNKDKATLLRSGPVTEEKLQAVLGYPESKQQAIESGAPAVVQGKDDQGNVVTASLASPQGVPAAAAHAATEAPHVEVTTPQAAQAARAEENPAVQQAEPAENLKGIFGGAAQAIGEPAADKAAALVPEPSAADPSGAGNSTGQPHGSGTAGVAQPEETSKENPPGQTDKGTVRVTLGTNRDGLPVQSDPYGVRSILHPSGIRETENVHIVPGRGTRAAPPAEKAPEFQIAKWSDSFKGQEPEYRPGPTENQGGQTEPPAGPTAPARPADYGAGNKLFTADKAEEARAAIRAQLNRLNSGIDPELLRAGITLAGYHVEAGARSFADYSRAMLEDIGEKIRPFLASFYAAVRHYPGFDATGMDDHATVEAELQRQAKASPEDENGNQDGLRQADGGGRPAGLQPTDPHGDDREAPAGGVEPGAPDAGGNPGPRTEGAGRPADAGRPAEGGGNRPLDVPERDAGADRPAAPGAGERPARPDAQVTGTDYRITPGEIAEDRGPTRKARDNLAAIQLTKQLIAEGRPATREEQAVLAKYVGWGGLARAFRGDDGNFGKGLEKVGEALEQILTPEELATARRSTQYAHYTAEHVIRSMWDAVSRMGFKGGQVFEPGMGIGHFRGMMPNDLADASSYQGVEMDHLTASIAKLLYPESGIRQGDYSRTPIPENSFDLVIGNPPFSDTIIHADPKYAARNFMLHDYFFAKSLDAVRPGGLLAFVTSAGTMNKLDSSAREYLAQRGEFVGGVRLPSSAFKQNAGTEVTTDILFFKKRAAPTDAAAAAEEPWTQTVARSLPDAAGGQTEGNVSRYFSEHPEQVLGREGFFDKLYKGRYAVHPEAGRDLPSDLQEAVRRLPSDIMEDPPTPEERAALDFASGQKKDGSFYLGPKGELMQYRDGAGRPVPQRGKEGGGFTAAERERITALVPIRDALRDVFRHDLAENEEDGARARAALNQHYDDFVAKYGPINKADRTFRRPTIVQQERARLEARENARDAGDLWDDGHFDPQPLIDRKASLAEIAKARAAMRERLGDAFREGSFDPSDMPDTVIEKLPNVDAFRGDPESYRLRAIEHYDDNTGQASKKDIFRQSVISRPVEPKLASAHDGVLWSLNQFGKLNVDAIADKLGRDRSAIVSELGDAVFRVPGTRDTYQTREEYLSGDVVAKLETARAEAMNDPALEPNVKALEAALPPPLPPSEISMTIGMPWIPRDDIETFAAKHLNLGKVQAVHIPQMGGWKVAAPTTRGAGLDEWSTPDRAAHELLSDALNRTPPRIYKTTGSGKDKVTVFDPVATQAAQDKVQAIKDAFQAWLESDPERSDRLANLYNDKLNRSVLRTYDGSYLTTPGVSAAWRWRPHQTRVVARIVQSGNTYMAHAVGAGKTSAMIGAGMEMRRLGLVRKPMYVVPNHMLGQFTKEFYEQYPTARIAVADEERFHTDRRRQFMADVAQDDLDAVIITHSSFGKIPISDDFQKHLIQEQLDQLAEALDGLNSQEDRFTIKQLEHMKEKLEQKLSKSGEGKDQTNTFEEMGADFLFVDEAHEFRKLSLATRQTSLKGISSEGSDKSWDLYTKLRYLDSKNPGRAAVLASGTPVTNTMGELYSISRYLQPEALAARGISHFDSWAATFGDTKADLEAMPDGSYKPVTRFAKFVNMPELYKMVGSVMDIVTPAQLEQYVTRPKLKTGQRQLHLAPFTDTLAGYQATLAQRMADIANRTGPPKKGDDILLSVINDGRHAALDPRFVMAQQSDPHSKLNEAISNVVRIWHETKDQQFYDPKTGYQEKADRGPAAQMMFLNLGVNGRGPMGFSSYAWIKSALQRAGIPANEIAFIGDYKNTLARQALFNDMNEGKVRILVGSTQKMGTGVNAQRRLYALHNLDPLWYPADDEQRVGRILRQGNMNPEIEVHDYTTTDTYDRTMWAMMGRKARFIEQFFRGDPELREMDDLGEAGVYEQASAMATSDPRIFQLTEMKQELDKLQRRASAHDRQQYSLRQQLKAAKFDQGHLEQAMAHTQQDIAQRQDTRADAFKMQVGDQTFTKRKEAAAALDKAAFEVEAGLGKGAEAPIGTIGGFTLKVARTLFSGDVKLVLQRNGKRDQTVGWLGDWNPAGAIQSIETHLRGFEAELADHKERHQQAQERQASIEPQLGKQFPHAEEVLRLRQQVGELEAQLKPKDEKKPGAPAPETEGGDEAAYQRPSDRFQERAPAVIAAVNEVLNRVAPGAASRAYPTIRDGQGEEVHGAYLRGRTVQRVVPDEAAPHLIAWSLASPDALRTVSHEAVHYLRRAGFFTPEEWDTLSHAAQAEGWLGRYDIPRRYADLSADRQLEEAVAERFADWSRGLNKVPGVLGRIFHRLALLRFQLASAARRVMGRDVTANDIFARAESGEVGRRQPAETGQRAPAEAALQRPRDERRAAMADHVGDADIPRHMTGLSRTIAEMKSVLAPASLRGAETMEGELREHGAQKARAFDQTEAALEHARTTLNQRSVAEQLEFARRYEEGESQGDPALDAVARTLRDVTMQWTRAIQGLGKGYLSAAIENYLGHVYSNYDDWAAGRAPTLTAQQARTQEIAKQFAKRPLRGGQTFLKQRKFPTLADAVAAGLTPVSTNPVELQLIKLREMQTFYYGDTLADRIKGSGLARWVPAADERDAGAAGLVKLDDRIFQPTLQVEGAAGPVTPGAWYAPEPAARLFNNYMSRGLAGRSQIYDAVRGAGNALNLMQLGLSGFHATFVAADAVTSQMALAVMQAQRGSFGAAAKNLATLPVSPVTALLRGNKVRAAWMNPAGADPVWGRIASMYEAGGGRMKMDRTWNAEARGSLIHNWQQGPGGLLKEAIGNAVQTFRDQPSLPGRALIAPLHVVGRTLQTMMAPLMELAVPRMKAGVFAALAQDWLTQHPDASPEEQRRAATQFQDSVDNRLGEMVYDNVFWHKTAKDMAFLSTRSVGWNLGTVRELGGGIADWGRYLASKATGGDRAFTTRMAYTLALPLTTAALGAMQTYISTGQGPQSLLDYFFPPDGAGGRLSLPTYMKDAFAFAHDPIGTVQNKANPVLSLAAELAKGTDYQGAPIYVPGHDNMALAYLEYLTNEVTPLSIRSLLRLGAQAPGDLTGQALSFWGITPAPSWIAHPERGRKYDQRQMRSGLRQRNREPGRIAFE